MPHGKVALAGFCTVLKGHRLLCTSVPWPCFMLFCFITIINSSVFYISINFAGSFLMPLPCATKVACSRENLRESKPKLDGTSAYIQDLRV